MIPLTTIGPVALEVQSVTFGFCNEPDSFEPLMERVLAGVPRSHCIVYLDSLLVHAADFESALANLCEVFQAICRAGLHLHPKKCHLLQQKTAFLGYVVGAAEKSTDPAKVVVVIDCPVPHNVRKLRSFLGLVSYYRRFVRDFAIIACPDTERAAIPVG